MRAVKTNSGFTLIELVVVILILGILAATALPKLIDLGSNARTAVIKSAGGALSAANSLIFAKAATTAGGLSGTSASLVHVLVNNVSIPTQYGYADTLADLLKATQIDTSTATGDFTLTGEILESAKAPTAAGCSVTYTPATSTTVPATVASAVVSGC